MCLYLEKPVLAEEPEVQGYAQIAGHSLQLAQHWTRLLAALGAHL